MSSDRIAALEQALALAQDNHPLRLILAELLQSVGRVGEAAAQYDTLLRQGQLPAEALLAAGATAVQANDLDLATRCLIAARGSGLVEGVAALQQQIDAQLERRAAPRQRQDGDGRPEVSERDLLDTGERITFADIGGLSEVKKVINRLIILPLQRPELYQAYRRQVGGGVLLYGPPGCGKTMLARATAAEVSLPFFNIRIEHILDPYIGVSERNLHGAFDLARRHAPCVLFIDELDALAFTRRRFQGSGGRALVDQMLQELDSIGSDNTQLLILAATNAPWDIDDALLRPGRFDRRVFVPPPDEPARLRILELLLAGIPAAGIDLRRLAGATALFSGADLQALVAQATDLVIDEALSQAGQPPLTMKHIEAARTALRPTTLDWLLRAQNYVEFSNQDDRYREVAEFLRSKEFRHQKR